MSAPPRFTHDDLAEAHEARDLEDAAEAIRERGGDPDDEVDHVDG